MTHVFRDSEFLSALEKHLVLRDWVRFLKRRLRIANFTRRLYEHLHLHCSFIAHYDRAGFYAEYFERGEDIVRFLSQFDGRGECRSVEYGGTWWRDGDYADLNRAMVEEGAKCIPALIENALKAQRERDLAAAEALLRKHGIEPR
jgi:hypothetical protein